MAEPAIPPVPEPEEEAPEAAGLDPRLVAPSILGHPARRSEAAEPAEAGPAAAGLAAELRAIGAGAGAAREQLAAVQRRVEALVASADAAGRLVAELDAERAAHAETSADLAAARADLRAARAAHAADADALAALRAELEAERAAHAVARGTAERRAAAAAAGVRALRAELDEARTAARDARAALLAGRARERPRRPPPDESELRRLAAEQARAAAAAAPREGAPAGRLVADLDAAAAALRAAAPPPPGAPSDPAVAAPPSAASPATAGRAPGSPPAAASPAAIGPTAASPAADAGPPPRRLRDALLSLAREDPRAAGELLVALLPAQAAVLAGPLSYDLTVRGRGTFAVTIAGGRARVERIARSRPRTQAAVHLAADPLALAGLLAGRDVRIGRLAAPVRLRGPRRALLPLRALPVATITLAQAAAAGARPAPSLALRALAHAVPPAWTHGHAFTVAHAIAGRPSETVFITALDGAGLAVRSRTAAAPDATVTMAPATFERLLRAEPVPAGERPVVRGDRAAVAVLAAWAHRARGVRS